MKIRLIIFLGIILAVVLETSFISSFFAIENVPNFVLILLLSAVIIFGFSKAWPWAILAGFIFDIFSYNRIGVSIIGFILLCYVVSFSSKRLILGEKIGGILVGFLLILFSTFFFGLWMLWANSGFSFEIIWAAKYHFIANLGWKIFFNLVLFVFSLLFFKHWEKKNSIARKLV